MNRWVKFRFAGLGVAVFAAASVVEMNAHSPWTFVHDYDIESGVYVCEAQHANYTITGWDTSKPTLALEFLGITPDAGIYDGTLLWRVGYSAGNYIRRDMDISYAKRDGVWEWTKVPWETITYNGGTGRWFAIEWHDSGGRSFASSIYFDDLLRAYEWVRSCQADEKPAVPIDVIQPNPPPE